MPEQNGAPVDDENGESTNELDKLTKQVAGVENLLGSFKKEQGDFREERKEIMTTLDGINQRLDSLKEETPSDFEYVTTETLDNYGKEIVGNIVGALAKTQQQGALLEKYKLTKEDLTKVEKFSEENRIGNLEAAHLLMNKEKFGTRSKKEIAEQLLAEQKETGDDVLDGVGETEEDRVDEPSLWLKNGETEKFWQWSKDNPLAHEKWLAKKEKK